MHRDCINVKLATRNNDVLVELGLWILLGLL